MSGKNLGCHFDNEDSLYKAYMPFIKGGGLFIRTKEEFSLGELIQLEITLFDEPELYNMQCRVIWITPKGSQGNRPCGIGLQFEADKSRTLSAKIETLLAGSLNSNRSTDTL
jgi:type IV pilus assembly protein PilZ